MTELRLRDIRKRRRLALAEIAGLADFSVAAVWERGRNGLSATQIVRAEALDVALDGLLEMPGTPLKTWRCARFRRAEIALSRLKHGFDSRRERQRNQLHTSNFTFHFC